MFLCEFFQHKFLLIFFSFVLYVSHGGAFLTKENLMKGLWLKEERSALNKLHSTFVHKGGTFLSYIFSTQILKMF